MGCGFDSRQSHMNTLYWFVLVAWLVAQLLKVFFTSLHHKKFMPETFISFGGMPSSHAALVSYLVSAVGIVEGVGSTVFVISLVFAAIVLHDAWAHYRLRRHTGPQVIAGMVVGVAIVFAGWLL